MKVKNDHRSKFSNLSSWKEEAWKNYQGFNGIRPRDLRDTSSYQWMPPVNSTECKGMMFINEHPTHSKMY